MYAWHMKRSKMHFAQQCTLAWVFERRFTRWKEKLRVFGNAHVYLPYNTLCVTAPPHGFMRCPAAQQQPFST